MASPPPQLCELLARIFEDRSTTYIALRELGLPTERFPLDEMVPVVRWGLILHVVLRQFPGKLGELVELAAKASPADREQLQEIDLTPREPASPTSSDSVVLALLQGYRRRLLVTVTPTDLKRLDYELEESLAAWRRDGCDPATLAEVRRLQDWVRSALESILGSALRSASAAAPQRGSRWPFAWLSVGAIVAGAAAFALVKCASDHGQARNGAPDASVLVLPMRDVPGCTAYDSQNQCLEVAVSRDFRSWAAS